MNTQAAAILAYLKSGKTLNPLEALDKFGCFRLGARVYELKRDGHDITKEMVKTPGGARVAEYYFWQPLPNEDVTASPSPAGVS